MSELSNADFIAASTDEEISALENFRRKYMVLVPPPTATKVTLLGALFRLAEVVEQKDRRHERN